MNIKDNLGKTPLHYVKNKKIAELLIFAGADVNIRDNRGIPPLFDKNMELMEFLISKGADINIKDDDGETILHLSVYNGSKDITEFLILNGVNVNAKDNCGRSPLHKAISCGNTDMAEFLIDSEALSCIYIGSGYIAGRENGISGIKRS